MTLIAVGSLHSSPGATTVTVALASCLAHGVVVEADRDGGVLAARFGIAREPGVVTLAADRDAAMVDRLVHHAQPIPGSVPAVIGPESSQHAEWLWQNAGEHLAQAMLRHAGDVVVDVGRLTSRTPPAVLTAAAVTLLVVRPTADELAIAAARLAGLEDRRRPALVLIGDRPYSAAEVSATLGAEVVGVIPRDERAVGALWDGGAQRQLTRSPFARSMRSLAEVIVERVAGENAGPHGDRTAVPAQ